MNRRLILHIGAHRTATSSLQAFLAANRRQLLQSGILFPFGVQRHDKEMNRLFSGKITADQLAARINSEAEAAGRDVHTVLISDEDICKRADLSPLAQLRRWFDVRVVFTLRRQDRWLESWFLQNVKWQWDRDLSHCSFAGFLAKRPEFHWIRYDRFISGLETLFGRENLILNIHEAGQMPEGPAAAFCDGIGLTARDGFTRPDHLNASFSPQVSEFMRCLPLDEAPVHVRAALNRACAAIGQEGHSGGSGGQLMLRYRQRRRIMAEYEEGNRAVARRYFGRKALFLDPLPGWFEPVSQPELPANSYDLMDEFVRPFVRALIEAEKRRQDG